jgi:hypothetical protein
MSTPQERAAMVLSTKQQLLAEKEAAEKELEDIKMRLAEAKERFRKNPHVKAATTHDDRKGEISVFLAGRQLNKDSILRQKAEETFEREKTAALELVRQKASKVKLEKIKEIYVEERSLAKSLIRVSGGIDGENLERKCLIHKAAKGEWTGSQPLSRMKVTPSKSSKNKGPKNFEDIPSRFPHSLFDRNES